MSDFDGGFGKVPNKKKEPAPVEPPHLEDLPEPPTFQALKTNRDGEILGAPHDHYVKRSLKLSSHRYEICYCGAARRDGQTWEADLNAFKKN